MLASIAKLYYILPQFPILEIELNSIFDKSLINLIVFLLYFEHLMINGLCRIHTQRYFMHQLHNKNFIYTVTTGRSGSNFIKEVFACLPDTVSLHEPKPRYDRIMRAVQTHPHVARQFLIEKKLPSIEKVLGSKTNYFETSHLFAKGFLEHWLNIEDLPVPNLICLNRSHRDVSLSFTRLNSIPGRSINGLTYLLSPLDPNNLTSIKGLKSASDEKYSDYQFNYWYCLEMEARKKYYADLIQGKGGVAVNVSVKDLKVLSAFNDFCDQLHLPRLGFWGRKRFDKMTRTVVNAKSAKKRALDFSEEQLDKWESEIKDNLVSRV